MFSAYCVDSMFNDCLVELFVSVSVISFCYIFTIGKICPKFIYLFTLSTTYKHLYLYVKSLLNIYIDYKNCKFIECSLMKIGVI